MGRLCKKLAKDIRKVECKALSPDFIRKATSLTEHSDNTLTNILLRGNIQETVEKKILIEEKLPDNLFCNRGGAWQVRYMGGTINIVIPSKGCVFLAKLLEQPYHRFDVEELDPPSPIEQRPVDVEELMDRFESGNGTKQDSLDERAIDECRKYRQVQLTRLQEAKDSYDKEEEEAAQNEVDRITEYLNANLQKNGRPRNLNKNSRLPAQALARDIKTVIKNIREFNVSLANHLHDSLELGMNPVYSPKNIIEWRVVVN